MKASKIVKMLVTVSVVAAGFLVVSCEVGQPPPQQSVRPVICNGQPDWCLIARSEMDARRPAYVYMDGEMKGLILPSKVLRIPVMVGEKHQVNFCTIDASKQWRCSTPTETSFDSGDSILVVFPLE